MFKGKSFKELECKKYADIGLSDEQAKQRYDALIEKWEAFLNQNAPNLQLDIEYFVHSKNLYEVIRRHDERLLYFYIFHGLEELDEYKDIAIQCFWINTLKPFMVIKEDSPIYSCPNEMFSLYLILTTIEAAYKKRNPSQDFKYPSPERIQDILYDFKYCSISREAMISFVETLADTYGVGITYILNQNK